MATAIPLAAPRAEAAASDRHRNLRLLSRALAVVFLLLLGLTILMNVALFTVGMFFPDHMYFGPKGGEIVLSDADPAIAGMTALSTQPLITRLAGVVDLVIATLPVALILWHLRALFRLYAAGTVFARENAMHLKRIGVWLIAFMPLKYIANVIFVSAGGLDKAWFHASEVYALILGFIVLVIAMVMEVGREIEQERSEFV